MQPQQREQSAENYHSQNRVSNNSLNWIKNLIIPLSFITLITTLYIIAPQTLEAYWTGRAAYLFITWLFLLELAIAWKKLDQNTQIRANWKKLAAALIVANIPLACLLATTYLDLKQPIIELGKILNIPHTQDESTSWYLVIRWPLTFEFIVLTVSLVASTHILYGRKAAKHFPISMFLAFATVASGMLDAYFSNSRLLQAPVPYVTNLSAAILQTLGYQTRMFTFRDGSVQLNVRSPGNPWQTFSVGWPCAGIHSLFIYTFVILLFMRLMTTPIPPKTVANAIPQKLKNLIKNPAAASLQKQKKLRQLATSMGNGVIEVLRHTPYIIVFAVGAAGTFFTNILRIVTIYVLAANYGQSQALLFHNYLGELFFIAWILLYLTIIAFGTFILKKLRRDKKKAAPQTT